MLRGIWVRKKDTGPARNWKRGGRGIVLTGVHGRDDALHDEDGQAVEPRQGVDRLADGRQLRHHVQEHGDERQEAQPQRRGDAVPLAHPLGQDEALGALAADDGAERGKDEQRERRREGVRDDALDAGDGGELRVREQDAGSEAWRG